MDAQAIKRIVGYKAVDDYVQSGMAIGLGTGSTAYFAVERIGEKLSTGELKNIICVPTSEATRKQAESLKIPLQTLNEISELHVCIDGADEVDSHLNLVKGRGAALLREKMVAQCAKLFVIVVDESKFRTEGLGCNGAVPVEVTKFSCQHILRQLQKAFEGCEAKLRVSNSKQLVETDNHNYIVDLHFDKPMKDLERAASDIANIVGVVEHGLFLHMASVCLVGKSDGSVYVISKPQN